MWLIVQNTMYILLVCLTETTLTELKCSPVRNTAALLQTILSKSTDALHNIVC